MTGSTCVYCGKKIAAGARADAKYCSSKCRQKAYNERQKIQRVMQAGNMDMFQQQDIATVRTVSVMAADFIVKMAAISGNKIAGECLDAMWDLAARCGCDFSHFIEKR